jgi:hypothetical protein
MSAERGGQLDPQSLVVQSIGVLIGSPLFIAGKLPWSFGSGRCIMRWCFLATVATGMIGGCTVNNSAGGGQDVRRYSTIEEICADGNYRGYRLLKTFGEVSPPFIHSASMDAVGNKGARKRVSYVERGTKVKRDLGEYDQQEVLLAFWENENDRENTLVLVMARIEK